MTKRGMHVNFRMNKKLIIIGLICFSLLLWVGLGVFQEEKNDVRGVKIVPKSAQSVTLSILWLVAANAHGEECVIYDVSGTRLRWSFEDLDHDGNDDLLFKSDVHDDYFAKFLISELPTKVLLLEKHGVGVSKYPEETLRKNIKDWDSKSP